MPIIDLKTLLMISTNQLLNLLFVAFAFVLPLSRAGITIFSLLIILLWLLSHEKYKRLKELTQSHAFQALMLFWLYTLVSLAWVESHNWMDAIGYAFKYWYFLVIVAIATTIEQEKILSVISAFILGMLISELLSYGIFFELISLNHGSSDNPTPFMNHLDYGLYLAFTSLLLLSRLLYEESLKYRLFYLLFFISVTINLFIIAGRIGYLAFGVGFVMLWMHRFGYLWRAFGIAMGALVVIVSLAFNLSNTFHERVNVSLDNLQKLYYHQDYCTSWGSRMGALIIAKEIVAQESLLGSGVIDHTDRLRAIIAHQYPQMECLSWFEHYHNQYAEVVTSLGLVGLVIFLSIFYALVRMRFENREFESIKVVFVSLFLVGFIAEPFMMKQFSLALFVLFFALLHGAYQYERSQKLTKF